eukprot:TRINITY_DN3976_c0_g1_i1.p1 TRINITY_DN3976_c0_g1~~TRINITY_DN3976_c0_g1_i1.p1  ORF type:complete len:528 (+),score=155.86 TRINITY_DN3976_c0_g1_i1:50-1633(+)
MQDPENVERVTEGDTEFLFVDVNPDNPVTKVESYCMECGQNGETTFMLTTVPHFREIIISHFYCPHCGEDNTGVQYGGQIQEKGVHISLRVTSLEDLNRQVVKSDTATIAIPHLEFEIPPETQKGVLSTVEGVISKARDGLEHVQPLRRIQTPEVAERIDSFIARLNECLEVNEPFVFIIVDPAGNSFIENPYAPEDDPELISQQLTRTPEQDALLGIDAMKEEARRIEQEEAQRQAIENSGRNDREVDESLPDGTFVRKPGKDASILHDKTSIDTLTHALQDSDVEKEVIEFQVTCSACPAQGKNRMVTVDIPYFKEVIVMAFSCDHCGFKSSEVKIGGAVSSHGRRIILKVENEIDLSRDVLKSDSASLSIPDLEFEMTIGSMGGRFTTVEGLLSKIKEDLEKNPFIAGDSGSHSSKQRFQMFVEALGEYINGASPFTLILDDPMSCSYIQDLYAPETDPYLTIEDYERTFEQNEEFGLNDMVTEGYYEGEDELPPPLEECEEINMHETQVRGVKPADLHIDRGE